MTTITRRRTALAALAIALCFSGDVGNSYAQSAQSITIGTGSSTGVYFPAGRAICRMLVNSTGGKASPWSCSAMISKGSVENVQNLASGKVQLGIAQSDVQHNAFKGIHRFRGKKKMAGLRAMFSLHTEAFTMVARADRGVRRFNQIKGKRINVGKKGSGPRETLLELLGKLGWRASEFAGFTQFGFSEHAQAMCDGRTDILTFVVGHPAKAVRDAMSKCPTTLVNVSGKAVREFVKERPYFRLTRIPAGLYRGANADIQTFGFNATVVATEKLDENTAYAVTRAVFENISKLRLCTPRSKD